MKCNPRKWFLWAIPLAGLPLLASLWLNGKGMEAKLAAAATSSLSGAKADWAKVSFTGRDALIEGNAPGRAAIEDAVKTVAATQGVRRVDATQAKVVLAEPTIKSIVTNINRPEITGTWPEIYAKALSVVLPDHSFVLGKDLELKSDGAGNWSYTPAEPLKDGAYEIAVEVDDGAGATSKTQTPGKVTVDTAPPPVPLFSPFMGPASPSSLSGSWAEGDATALKVGLAGKSYTLGQDPALTSAGGKWSLALPEPLAEGVYDLTVEAIDAAGNSAQLKMPAAVTISTKPQTPTVAKYSGNDTTPLLSGSWGEVQGSKLTVALAGLTYELGRDANLTSDGRGNWRLDVTTPLKDGTYDVAVTVTDAEGKAVSDDSASEIEIDATAPAAPVVNKATALPVTGSFASGDTKVLRATLAGHSYTLGQDAALTAQGDSWSLMPPDKLAAGTYDVIVEAVDALGNASADASKDELVIAGETPPPTAPPSSEMAVPTVSAQEATTARPTITGTWAEGLAKSLKVTLAGASYGLGANEELTSSAGQWSLKPPSPLKDGTYDVSVETTDAAGKTVTDATKDEIIVDAAGPASPTVKLYAALESPTAISGTWPEGDAVALMVTFDNKTATLGKDASLGSDGKGNWSLAVADKLPPGSYDVIATATDKRGRSASDQTRFEILVKEASTNPPPTTPPPTTPPPTTPPTTADCASGLAKTLIDHPLHFERDKSAVTEAAAPTIKDLAAIAASCPSEKLEVGGHTDNIGSESYNQALSERRAVAVMHALVAAGVDFNRLSAVGYGETVPVGDNATDEGRALNRRIEIKIVK
jgi:outer membrane protein OmpA-like peptidoglycan-associated protein